ncbi:MAG: cysteine desulfurase [Hyphomicrobium sp.]|nr:cysteine desulfurase [Hyphomicrobium sp.]
MSIADLARGPADLDALAAAVRGVGGGGLTPPAGLPDPALLARMANQFFAALPGQSVPVSAGPSLSGLGASPVDVAGTSVPHVASLPSSIDAGPSLAGHGTSSEIAPGGDASVHSGLPGNGANGIPQPPAVSPPDQVLVDDSGIATPLSAGTQTGSPIELPYERELQALLAPLNGSTAIVSQPVASASTPYFLTGAGAPAFSLSQGAPHTSPFGSAHPAFDVHAIRRDFPILQETVNGRPLIWFDNAATTQKPKAVIDRLTYFYEHENSNIHRAAHELAARATDAYEGARSTIARFLGASSAEEIVYVRGATEAVNLVAGTYGRQHVGPGDEIVLTNLEHHANIVPWQQLALEKGAKIRVAPVDDRGALLLDEFGKLLNPRTKIVAFTHVSNALGTINPVKAMTGMAHRVGACVVIDGAQSVSHMKVDVQDIDADFYLLSGHKLFGPTGIGALYGKKKILDSLPPYQTGGNMIRDVTFERTEFNPPPWRFEAGTGNIADAVGLGAAIDYIERIGLDNIGRYEHALLEYATHRLQEIPNLRIIGTAPEKASVISLVIKGVPSEEVGARLNKYGIAVRSGHHCAQPILRRFGQETTVRPSFAFYNTCAEIDVLVAALKDIQVETGLTRV